jgi:hypothetical protein
LVQFLLQLLVFIMAYQNILDHLQVQKIDGNLRKRMI